MAKFPERDATNIFKALDDASTPNSPSMKERYPCSKLLEVLAVRELAELYTQQNKIGTPNVIVNCLNPGFCVTQLARSATGRFYVIMKTMHALFGWTGEQGSRNLVNTSNMGAESHGKYTSYSAVVE